MHARVSIDCSGATLAWSTLNVERDEDRLRLCNSAYKHLQTPNGMRRPTDLAAYPSTYLKYDFDNFCAGLWDAQLERDQPEAMPGAAERIGPSFLLRPYILAGGGTIVFAPPGRGKSFALLLMAVSLEAGISTLWPVQHTRVLFINLERSKTSVQQRVGNCNAVLGLDRTRPLPMINARGRSLVDVAAAAERYIGEHQVGCVLVDSISRAGAGDLNANESVNRIIDQLNRFEIAWVGLGHTPRSDESHIYGGVHFEAGADLVVQLLSEQEENGPLGVGLQLTKKNDVGSAPMWISALEFDELGLVGVRRARPGEFLEIESNKRMTTREAIRQHLLDMGAQSIADIAEALDLSTDGVKKTLQRDPGRFQQVGVDSTRKGRPAVLWGVVDGHLLQEFRDTHVPKVLNGTPSDNVSRKSASELPF